MDREFIIPLEKEDLTRYSDTSFSVTLLPFNVAVAGVKELNFSIKKKGCLAILDHFDVCFSFLFEPSNLSFDQLQEFHEEVIEEYQKDFCSFVEKSLELDPSEKRRSVNVIKMVCYLFCFYIKTYEDKLFHQSNNQISEPKRAKSRFKNKAKPEEMWPWSDKKLETFAVIYSFLRLPLYNLWQTRIVEDSLVNLLAGCCFKTFENSEMSLVKSKPLKDSVSQVLSLLVSHYNYTVTFLPKAIEMMTKSEHIPSLIANSVFIMQRDFNCSTILDKMLTELLDLCENEPQTSGKAVSTFVTELGENHPELFINSVETLTDFLCVDSYSVRNAVLITFSEMVIHCFSEENLTKESITIRNDILKELQGEILDENAYVRSKVLHLWTKLSSHKCIPVDSYCSLLRGVKSCLLDKSISVSKNAIHFFSTALEHNPYGGKLNLSEVDKEKETEIGRLKELMDKKPLPPEERWTLMEIDIANIITDYFSQGNESNEIHGDPENADIDIKAAMFIIANLIKERCFIEALKLLKSSETVYPDSHEIRCNLDRSDPVAYYVASLKKIYLTIAGLNPQGIVPDYYENNSKIESGKALVKYWKNCSDFIDCVNKASEIIYQLMFSVNTSEVLESIDFFSKAYKFRIGNSEKAVRDMLILVNSNTPELKDAVAKAYNSLYLETSKPTPRAKAAHIAQRLVKLVKGLDQNQKLAFEELLQKWVKSNILDKEFISVLLQKAFQPEETQIKSASSDCNAALLLLDMIAGVNTDVVSGNIHFLKELLHLKYNNTTIKLACSLIQRLSVIKRDKKPVRYLKDDEIFTLSVGVLLEKFPLEDDTEYIAMAAAVIDLIFHLCFHPETLGDEIILKLYRKVIESSSQVDNVVNEEIKSNVVEHQLKKLFFVCGHILLRKWQYCEKDVFNCLRKCQDGDVVDRNPNESLDDYEIEADNVVAADDALYQDIVTVCERFLVKEGSLIEHIVSLVLDVCKSNDDKVSPALKASAALALAKFMLISGPFCENQFQIYATMMDRCKHEAVRSSLVLGFGDLLRAHPNTVEPWTSYLYNRLKDHSEVVRLNTVSVLCHLINIEMIKVKGSFAELLLHMEDPHPVIAEKVNSLLMDLSMKGNTIYNVIPEVISRLSNPERSEPVSSSTFKLVISRLFKLITKERQSELLVEKLCLRLRESSNERQSEDLVYCLTQFHYSEKSLKKLFEALSTLKDRLCHPPVHDTIASIINTCIKSTKPALKELAREAMDKLEELMTVTNEDGDMSCNDEKESGDENENRKIIRESSCERSRTPDSNISSEFRQPTRATTRQNNRLRKIPRKNDTPSNSSDDDSSNEFTTCQKSKPSSSHSSKSIVRSENLKTPRSRKNESSYVSNNKSSDSSDDSDEFVTPLKRTNVASKQDDVKPSQTRLTRSNRKLLREISKSDESISSDNESIKLKPPVKSVNTRKGRPTPKSINNRSRLDIVTTRSTRKKKI